VSQCVGPRADGSASAPRVEAVAYDEPMAEVPHEERMIRDAATFSTFAERSASLIRPFVYRAARCGTLATGDGAQSFTEESWAAIGAGPACARGNLAE